MYQAFYRKWRPTTFDDVCGQAHITSVLKYEVENEKTSHAYLFCGTRGTGKTSCAKILAKAINCLSPKNGNPCGECEACRAIAEGTATDVVEMDAASNNGVEYIREIRDEVAYLPAMLKKRVYIIDEVHMLSVSAFNALLKTLEEPPAHVVFILATTEMQKIPPTILSRCQRFSFKRISIQDITGRLAYISEREGIVADAPALMKIARNAQGGMRDAISMLELCASEDKHITDEVIANVLGVGLRESLERVVDAVISKDYEVIFKVISDLYATSSDITVFWQELIDFYRDMLVVKTSKHASDYLDLTETEFDAVKRLTDAYTGERLLYHAELLGDAFMSFQKNSELSRSVAEMTLLRMCDDRLSTSSEALLARISALENSIRALGASGMQTAPATQRLDSKPKDKQENKAPEPEHMREDTASDTVAKATVSARNSDGGEKPESIRSWIDIVKRCEETDSATAAILKPVRAFTTGDRVLLYTNNAFNKSMLEKDSLKRLVAELISGELGRSFTEDNITVLEENKKLEYDALDDFTDIN